MECWICLSGDDAKTGCLADSFCKCSADVRPVHGKCLGRWQLQRAGTREETHCRFCSSKYQLDWRATLAGPTPVPHAGEAAKPAAPRRPPTPIMAIMFEGQVHRIKVYPGPEGKARFQQQIRELVKLRDDEEFEVEFECKAPDSGAMLHLDGMDAFDAATHCASLTAAERLARQRQQQEQQQQQDEQEGAHSNASTQQQERQARADSRNRTQQQLQGASADVQLQVAAALHGAAGLCPGAMAQHGTSRAAATTN